MRVDTRRLRRARELAEPDVAVGQADEGTPCVISISTLADAPSCSSRQNCAISSSTLTSSSVARRTLLLSRNVCETFSPCVIPQFVVLSCNAFGAVEYALLSLLTLSYTVVFWIFSMRNILQSCWSPYRVQYNYIIPCEMTLVGVAQGARIVCNFVPVLSLKIGTAIRRDKYMELTWSENTTWGTQR